MFDLFIFLYGIIIGSFLNVLIFRLPSLELNLFRPKRSICLSCQYKLRWSENIPLLSYILLKARCSNCNAKISFQYFFVELLSGFISVVVFYKLGFSSQFFYVLLLFYILIVLSFIDLKYKAVPDYLLLLLLIIACLIENIDYTIALIFAGAFVLLDFCITFYIQNIKSYLTKNESLKTQVALGEGDIPVVAVLGGILGIEGGILAIFLAALFALIPALYGMIFKKEIETPFIPYLALGFAAVYFAQPYLQSFILRVQI